MQDRSDPLLHMKNYPWVRYVFPRQGWCRYYLPGNNDRTGEARHLRALAEFEVHVIRHAVDIHAVYIFHQDIVAFRCGVAGIPVKRDLVGTLAIG